MSIELLSRLDLHHLRAEIIVKGVAEKKFSGDERQALIYIIDTFGAMTYDGPRPPEEKK